MSDGERWWLNGELVAPAAATLSAVDHGFTVGDGCFETTGVVRGEAFALTRHLRRLRRSLASLLLELPMTDDELSAAIEASLATRPDAGVVRMTVTAGQGPLGSGRNEGDPTVLIALGPNRGWDSTAHVITVPWPRNERGALAGVKSTSYAENVVALARAKQAGASEAIFPNTIGNLCEGTGTNIFVELDGRLVTPPLSSGCLAGVTRDLVIEVTGCEEIDVPIEHLTTTAEAFLTSSTRDVMPITQIDDRELTVGGLSTSASAAFADLVAATTDP
jgi:branched-chain amino acid aminotransferase